MKPLILLSIVLLSIASVAQCYGGNTRKSESSVMLNFIRNQLMKKPAVKNNNNDVAADQREAEDESIVDKPVYVGSHVGLKESDKISSLPGQPTGLNFDQYSGYVTVDPNAGRALFYYFVESLNSSSTATTPLVLWLNGGPGCSSFGNGAMTELGPFRVNRDGATLWYNTYAWNNVANVIFLESPAGVGFSYSNTTSDFEVGDKRSASDAYTFLVNWLERFPEYKTRDFYLTGESYAGHYVPQLAQLILQKNKITNQTTVINLKGIAIGNAFVDYETQYKGYYDYIWSHALISDEIHQGIVSNCNFSSSTANDSATCDKYLKDVYLGDNLDEYDIYYPSCSPTSYKGLEFDPCSGEYVYKYLNTPQVQKSLHANLTGSLPGHWSACTNSLTWTDTADTVLNVIQELMASGLRVWMYSGDTDAVVPITSTRYAINKELGKSIKTPWYPWNYKGEVGGYVVEYENITLVTIKGAGHLVPSYQPGRALVIFTSFIEGRLPPKNKNV